MIRAEAERLATALVDLDPAMPLPTCPEWTASDLLWHVAEVHWFWANVLSRGAITDADVEQIEETKPVRPDSMAELALFRAQSTDALCDQLAVLADDEHRWSWSGEHTVGFTRRMQVFEATMHRVDAELTAGLEVTPLDPEVAAGAVGHAVAHMWGWLPAWATYTPAAVVAFETSDTGDRWLAEVGRWQGTGPESGRAFDEPTCRPSDGEPAATVRAPAQQLALWAWRRGGAATPTGSPEAVAALMAVVENGIQ